MHQNTLLFHDYTYNMYILPLMHAEAVVNAKDLRKWTPLHVAAAKGEQRLMKCLLDNKADVMAKDLDGNTPVDIVLIQSEYVDIENENSVKSSLEDLMSSGRNISDDEVREKIWELSPSRYAARLILFIPLLSLDPHTCLQCSQNVQA